MNSIPKHVEKFHVNGDPRRKSQFFDTEIALWCIVTAIGSEYRISGERYVFEKTFPRVIGYTEWKGHFKHLRRVRVVVNRYGAITTAYPC